MARLFFGKMKNENEVMEKTYRTSVNGESFLGGILEGDYAFIKLAKESDPACVKRLWRLKEIQRSETGIAAIFDEICQFDPVSLLRFEALDLFELNVNLLNKCNKQTKGLSFVELTVAKGKEVEFEALVKSPEKIKAYVGDNSHYRKMFIVANREQAITDSIDVQFYREGDSWALYKAVFLGQDLLENFDSNQFDSFNRFGKKGSNTAKEKMFRFLSGIGNDEPPMMGLWDLFCGFVKENTEADDDHLNRRDGFRDYCKTHGVEHADSQYESGIRAIEVELAVNIDDEFRRDECESLQKKLEQYIKDNKRERRNNQNNWLVYLKKYIEYKKSLISSQNPLENDADDTSVTSASYDYAISKHSGINKVFYGTPGCGKSYYLDNTVLNQEDFPESFRTTFYQDYSYTDFVGQVLPEVVHEKVSYRFIPGPFTLALESALKHPEIKVALVVEELNRGNAPSIFGDIFQLLDRQNGVSRYSITNVNIQAYLKEKLSFDFQKIRIPANLYLFATMNTSDQGVFTLDTAFKRRWKFEKITNDFLAKDSIGDRYVPGLSSVTWRTFVNAVNEHILNHAQTLSAEDKQLGKYFVDPEVLMESADETTDEEFENKLKDFAYKVFEYLWADVAKFNRNEWFDERIKSLDSLIREYLNHANVFVSELATKLPVYAPAEEEE